MSQTELKSLAKIIRNGWKQLATSDQTDADEMLAAAKEILEALEELEAAE
jgi:hypothetical protein